jgi:2-polyprenyl-6-methoxyphenol hydroxylase-like FAD-dependent oxidoreductase
MDELVKRGLARTGVERRMIVGRTRRVTLPSGNEKGALISQSGLLQLLHERCSKEPGYEMHFGTTALRATERGVEARKDGEDIVIEGDIVVACNGRNSKLRKDLGELELDVKPGDTIWLRFDFSDAKDALPKDVDVHMFGKGVVVVLFATTKDRLQIAYSAPGDMGALRKNLPALRDALLPRLNEPLRSLVDQKLNDQSESQMLKVSIDRMKTWHAPKLLLLGDAAHTMGPAGAQGLNLAIRDAIVAGNHFVAAIDAEEPLDLPRSKPSDGARSRALRRCSCARIAWSASRSSSST